MAYLNWDTTQTEDFSAENIARLYDEGYVFTRVGKGIMNKTRSFRVNLSALEMSSENRRIARKNEHLSLSIKSLPLSTPDYSWEIGKLAKDFYDAHGAEFSANKVKELLTDATASNFNTLLVFTDTQTNLAVGYAICYTDARTLHYSYPFYMINPLEPSRGLGMMIRALEYAKAQGLSHAYLGSLQRPSDTYKLQFKGGEWFDGDAWQWDTSPLKEILK
jgi:arginyl-tRNA--protein-N-Asp/Glu arginylyltransferase